MKKKFTVIFVVICITALPVSLSWPHYYPNFIPYRPPVPTSMTLPSPLPLASEAVSDSLEETSFESPVSSSSSSSLLSNETSSTESSVSSSTTSSTTTSTTTTTTVAPKIQVVIGYPYRPNGPKQQTTNGPKQQTTNRPNSSPSFSRRLSSMLRSMRQGFEEFTSSFDPDIERVIYQEQDEDGFEKLTPLVEMKMKSSYPGTDQSGIRKSSAPLPKILSCRVYEDPKNAQDRLKNPVSRGPTRKEMITNHQMSLLLSKCPRNPQERISGDPLYEGDDPGATHSVFKGVAIWPGTKWCGAGDIAVNDDDLGSEKEADACCRDHDKCPDNISPGEFRYNLTNKDSYTKSNCECDAKFFDCLRSAKTFVGDQIGRMYFNVIQIQCFRNEHPVVNCTQEKGFLMNTVRKSCQKYDLDESQPKRYQFFDPPFYVGQAGPLLHIPVVSSLLEKPVNDFKNISINGGAVGNIIAG